jgi:hypothetical protein
VKMTDETQNFEIEVDGHRYRIQRRRSAYGKWKWEWTVHGGTVMRSRWCDPDGRTYKKVVAAAEQILENGLFVEEHA